MINIKNRRLKERKNKSKIKYKKVFIFLLCFIILISGISFGVWKVKDKLFFWEKQTEEKPVYYLLIGEDENKNADAIAVVSLIDNSDGFTIISFPPNTKINNTKEDKDVLLKETLVENGADGVKSAIENLLHIKIDKYAVFDYNSFIESTKFSKNFDFYVEKQMEHTNSEGNYDIQLKQGYQQLSNSEMLAYIRYIDEQNEIERIQHQERLAKSLIRKYGNNFSFINKIGAYYFWKPKESNISSKEASDLILKLINSKEENSNFVILPGEEQLINKNKVWIVNQNELQKTIALTLNK